MRRHFSGELLSRYVQHLMLLCSHLPSGWHLLIMKSFRVVLGTTADTHVGNLRISDFHCFFSLHQSHLASHTQYVLSSYQTLLALFHNRHTKDSRPGLALCLIMWLTTVLSDIFSCSRSLTDHARRLFFRRRHVKVRRWSKFLHPLLVPPRPSPTYPDPFQGV